MTLDKSYSDIVWQIITCNAFMQLVNASVGLQHLHKIVSVIYCAPWQLLIS